MTTVPREVSAVLNRSHWLVKRGHAGGCSFLLAVGRNIQAGAHKGLGLHPVDSPEGRHILAEAEGKRQERLELVS
jgi:hypothetical protein